jgi:hypothetical protein
MGMKTCGRCQREKVHAIELDDNIDVCGHTFTAQVPAEKCGGCGEIVIQGHDIKLFELRIAIELAKAGLRTGESFKYLRKALALQPRDVGQLLDVPEDFIGYWENGDWPVDPRAHSVLCSFVLAKYDHSPTALDCLKVLREPRKLARKIRLHLIDAVGHATKTLQFGSAARSAPALA